MKKILTIFSGLKVESDAVRFSNILAESLDAENEFFYLSQEYEQLAKFAFGAGVVSSELYDDFKKNFEHEHLTKLRNAEKIYKTYVTSKKANFFHESGEINEIASEQGRYSDLIVLPANIEQINEDYIGIVNTMIFETGAPVVLLPEEIEKDVAPKSILIAWDGSVRASKAVKASLPILKNAKKIFVVGVNETDKDVASANQLLNFLKAHKVNAKHLGVKKAHFSVGQTILDEAEKQKCDMVVMGAYNHNKIRQMVLGGATRYMLSHPKIPVFMQH